MVMQKPFMKPLNQNKMEIDQEEFNRKAQHIIDTVVKPQVEKYERAKAIEEAAASLADPNLCKTDNWIAGAKWMEQQINPVYKEYLRIVNEYYGVIENNEDDENI